MGAATIREIAIKANLGKVRAPDGLETSFERDLEHAGFTMLPVQVAHAAAVASLPLAHRDPFDRLLISQCRVEGIPAMTGDAAWRDERYGIRVVW